jgi:type IV secretion system protein VirB11
VVDLVRDSLRLRPDRIVVGEMRDGAAALETLKTWNTGHPGGLSTIHANSAHEALLRLEDLTAEVSASVPRRAIGQALDLVIHIARTREGRRVETIITIDGEENGTYRTRPAG